MIVQNVTTTLTVVDVLWRENVTRFSETHELVRERTGMSTWIFFLL